MKNLKGHLAAAWYARWNAGWSRHDPLYLFGVLRGLHDLSRLKWDGSPYRKHGPHVRAAYNVLAETFNAPLLK